MQRPMYIKLGQAETLHYSRHNSDHPFSPWIGMDGAHSPGLLRSLEFGAERLDNVDRCYSAGYDLRVESECCNPACSERFAGLND